MNARWMLCAALTVGFTLGCMGGGEEVATEEAAEEMPDTPEGKAAAIVKALEADKSKADEVLEKYGMSAEEFEDLMVEVAKDPKRTDSFLEARDK